MKLMHDLSAEELIDMWRRGISRPEIRQMTGWSEGKVAGLCWRLGLSKDNTISEETRLKLVKQRHEKGLQQNRKRDRREEPSVQAKTRAQPVTVVRRAPKKPLDESERKFVHDKTRQFSEARPSAFVYNRVDKSRITIRRFSWELDEETV